MIFGYTVANDVTARDLQRGDVQFTRAKGFDSFCPLGPWIETDLDHARDLRVTDPPQRRPRAGRPHQGHGLRRARRLVAHVSAVMTLLPGDVILTGTPEGSAPCSVGDEVEVTVDGIGTLTNKVVTRD